MLFLTLYVIVGILMMCAVVLNNGKRAYTEFLYWVIFIIGWPLVLIYMIKNFTKFTYGGKVLWERKKK